MRLATVSTPSGTTAAVRLGDSWHRLPAADLSALLAAGVERSPGEALPDSTPVLPLPQPGKVICCGLNYGDHIAETGREVPTHPTLFAKYADTLVGPDADITLPVGLEVDWEAELAVV